MDSIKEIKQHKELAENQFKEIAIGLEKKIGHKLGAVNIKLMTTGDYTVDIIVDAFDTFTPPSKLINVKGK